MRWPLKITAWVQHSIDSHPFNSMSIGHPIPEIWLFQNLTLKIQGQGHGWGEHWKSQSGCNILSIHIPFVPHGLRGTLRPSGNKGTLAGTRQLKRISEQKDTLSCHLSHLLCLFKWFNRPERPMFSVAVNYRYRRYKSIWKFRSIIDMDFSISIYRVSNLTSPIMG